MSDAPDNHQLARQFAVLEERMNTMKADLSATLERFRADMAGLRDEMAKRDTEMAKRDTEMANEMARRDIETAKRDNRLLWAVIGLALAVILALGRSIFTG